MHGLNRLPDPPDFVGRKTELSRMAAEWERTGRLALVGPSGVGKTLLLRRFLGAVGPERGIVRVLDDLADCDALFDELFEQLAGKQTEARGWGRVDRLWSYLDARPDFVLVLDALEHVQDERGSVGDPLLAAFLDRYDGRCLVTSLRPVAGMLNVPIGEFDDEDARALLAYHEVDREVVTRHPLALRLIAGAEKQGIGVGDAVEVQAVIKAVLEKVEQSVRVVLQYLATFPEWSMRESILRSYSMSVTVLDRACESGLVQELSESRWRLPGPVRTYVGSHFDLTSVHRSVSERLQGVPPVAPHEAPQVEQFHYHLVRAGQLERAWAYQHEGGFGRICLDWGDYGRALRMSVRLLRASEGAVSDASLPRVAIRLLVPLLESRELPLARITFTGLWLLAFNGAPLPAYSWLYDPRPRWLGDLYRHVGMVFDILGLLNVAARYYRKAYRLARGDDPRALLYSYTQNASRRGRLRLAERLAREARRLTCQWGAPAKEPYSYVALWQLLRVQGKSAITLPFMLELDIQGMVSALLTTIRLREGLWKDAFDAARLGYLQTTGEPLKAQFRALGLQAMVGNGASFDETEPLEPLVENLVEWAARTGLRQVLIQVLISSGTQESLRGARTLARAHGYRILQMDADVATQKLGPDATLIDMLLKDARRMRYAWAERALLALKGEEDAWLEARLLPPDLPEPREQPHDYWPCSLAMPEFPGVPLPDDVLVEWSSGFPPLILLLPVSLAGSATVPVASIEQSAGHPPLGASAPPPVESTEPRSRHALYAWFGGRRESESVPVASPERGVMLLLMRAFQQYDKVRDTHSLYQLAALLTWFGHSTAREVALGRFYHDETADPLLVCCLMAASGPTPSLVTRMTACLEQRRKAHPRLRAAVWWNLGALQYALGDSAEAHDSWHESRRLKRFDFIEEVLDRFPRRPSRPVCRPNFTLLTERLEQWRRMNPQSGYPASLDMLVPRWWAHVPACPVTGRPLMYRTNRYRSRYVVGCREHYVLIDSTLGTLGRTRPDHLPSPVGLRLGKLADQVVRGWP